MMPPIPSHVPDTIWLIIADDQNGEGPYLFRDWIDKDLALKDIEGSRPYEPDVLFELYEVPMRVFYGLAFQDSHDKSIRQRIEHLQTLLASGQE